MFDSNDNHTHCICYFGLCIIQITFFLVLSDRLEQLVQPKPRHREWHGDRWVW